MKRAVFVYNIVLSLLGIVIGLLFCVADPEQFLKFIFIAVGIFIILNFIPLLLTSIVLEQGKEKTILLIYCFIEMTVGLLLIIYPNTIAYIIAGAFLIVLPIARIVFSKDHLEVFKKELIKLVLGVILIACGVSAAMQIVLYIIGGIIILASLSYMVYNIVLMIKINRIEKKEREDNEVIDV